MEANFLFFQVQFCLFYFYVAVPSFFGTWKLGEKPGIPFLSLQKWVDISTKCVMA